MPESVPSTEIVKVLPEETTKLFSEVTSVAAPPLHPDTGVKNQRSPSRSADRGNVKQVTIKKKVTAEEAKQRLLDYDLRLQVAQQLCKGVPGKQVRQPNNVTQHSPPSMLVQARSCL